MPGVWWRGVSGQREGEIREGQAQEGVGQQKLSPPTPVSQVGFNSVTWGFLSLCYHTKSVLLNWS